MKYLKYFTLKIKLTKIFDVRCGVRTHAHIRVPELKSGALDHSANLTWYIEGNHFHHDNRIIKFICLKFIREITADVIKCVDHLVDYICEVKIKGFCICMNT